MEMYFVSDNILLLILSRCKIIIYAILQQIKFNKMSVIAGQSRLGSLCIRFVLFIISYVES